MSPKRPEPEAVEVEALKSCSTVYSRREAFVEELAGPVAIDCLPARLVGGAVGEQAHLHFLPLRRQVYHESGKTVDNHPRHLVYKMAGGGAIRETRTLDALGRILVEGQYGGSQQGDVTSGTLVL
jgi:hypothetical protein